VILKGGRSQIHSNRKGTGFAKLDVTKRERALEAHLGEKREESTLV